MRPRVLLEINVAGEGSKIGFAPEKLRAEMEMLLRFGRVEIEGLMAIPPLAAEPEQTRPYFAGLRELRDALEREFAVRLPQLSMGMSSDFSLAVAAGSTMIRVGSAIFGDRT